MVGNYYVRSCRQWCVHDFTHRVQTTNPKSIAPKNENFEGMFFGFLERNDGYEKWKKYDRPEKEDKGNIDLP